ncbi:MAG: hypothetical protein LAP87_02765 [Acidobacteriia bacterium]|nr:hypothetical protein [Terriglobia bacterium]
MSFFNRLSTVLVAAALLGPMAPLDARNRKGDKFLADGRIHEEKKEWDAALESYEKALSEDPAELVYQMGAQRSRFQASQKHVENGLKIRAQGQLGEALLEFQKGYAQNPGSQIAAQEIITTQQMIERERKRMEQLGKESAPEERALTPSEEARKQTQDKISRMLPIPELRPLKPNVVDLKMNSQPVKVLFETVGKLVGINVLWDPDYTPPAPGHDKLSVTFENSTLEQALDYLAVVTKSYWKALSPNTIFVTNDNQNKRRDYEEQVTKIFYLQNAVSQQDMTEMVTAIRTVADCQRLFQYQSANAIVAKCEADKIALAEKIINDLDKPRSEVVVDILVIEASSIFNRQLTAALASTGLNVPGNFTPRSGLQVVTQPATTPAATGTTDTTTTPVATTTTGTGGAIPLANLGHLSSADFSTILPSALLQATLSDTKTKVLQAPQLRSVDLQKATLNIGEREPTASGSFQPGIGGVGINPLVNTQFQFIDVGVNLEILPHVHENGDVTMHVHLEISSVTNHVNLGGIDQPVIGQRKIDHDVRLREGEVTLLAGLVNSSSNKIVTGIPGLSSIPLLRRLFTGESINRERDEVMIALIPHIVRRPNITAENLRAVAVGNGTTIHINYAPRQTDATAGAGVAPASVMPGAPAVGAPGAQPPTAGAPPATAPPATAPPDAAPPATAPPETPAGPAARMRFNQTQMDKNVSDNFTLDLLVQGATDLTAAPMQILYDPRILKLNDIVRGDFWASDGQEPVFTKNIQNDTGTAVIQLARKPGSPGVNGNGTLLTLSFQVMGHGTGAVAAPNLTLKNSQGQTIGSGTPQVIVNVK